MSTPTHTADDALPNDPGDFSLTFGGPLFKLWQRAHLAGDTPRALLGRIAVLTLVAWLPLLALSSAEGHAWGGAVRLTWIRDVELHVRLLLALPLLMVAEAVVEQRLRPVVRQFLVRGLIPEGSRAKFDAACTSAMRLRNSVTAEVLLIAIVYVVGVGLFWRTQVAIDVPSWYGVPAERRLQPSLAGWWQGCVSNPLFQFLLLRWYFRLFVWTRFLWQVSRIQLKIVPTHPDGCGGLAFLGQESSAFGSLLVAQGAVLAALIANQIFYAGATLLGFAVEIGVVVVAVVLSILGPLLVFSSQLVTTKRLGRREYGALAQRYVSEFDRKWVRGGAPADEPLLGSADIQSLADLRNSYEGLNAMQSVPFDWQTAATMAALVLLPVAPLLLTMFPLGELIEGLLKLVF